MEEEEEPILQPEHTAVSINSENDDTQPLISKKEGLPEAEASSLKGNHNCSEMISKLPQALTQRVS